MDGFPYNTTNPAVHFSPLSTDSPRLLLVCFFGTWWHPTPVRVLIGHLVGSSRLLWIGFLNGEFETHTVLLGPLNKS